MNRSKLLKADRLIDGSQAGVFVDRVVGNEDRRGLRPGLATLVGLSIRLSVENLIVVNRRGQKGGLCKILVDASGLAIRHGRSERRLVLLRTMNCLIEAECLRQVGRVTILRMQYFRPEEYQE